MAYPGLKSIRKLIDGRLPNLSPFEQGYVAGMFNELFWRGVCAGLFVGVLLGSGVVLVTWERI